MAAKFEKFKLFPRDVQLSLDAVKGEITPLALAKFAKSELLNAITNREASPIYDRWVNGIQGAPEESVEIPGPILYEFSYWNEIIRFVQERFLKRSPIRSGRYRDSLLVMVGGQTMRSDAEIGADEEVIIVNTAAYARKIEVGHMKMLKPGTDEVFQKVRRDVVRQYGGAEGPVEAKVIFMPLPGGYVLKGIFKRGWKPNARTSIQKDTAAGQTMKYPALVMRMK